MQFDCLALKKDIYKVDFLLEKLSICQFFFSTVHFVSFLCSMAQ